MIVGMCICLGPVGMACAQTETTHPQQSTQPAVQAAPTEKQQATPEQPKPRAKPAERLPAKSHSAQPAKKGGAVPSKSAHKKGNPRHGVAAKETHAKKTGGANEPTKLVVRHGGAKDPKLEIAPAESRQQEAQTSRSTAELLASTDQNLKKISGRKLSPQQQDMVGQIQNYVSQAMAAEKSGDMERAESFASKAKQLSDEMVNP